MLTDENFADKLRDLFTHNPSVTPTDIRLLTVGRHYRLASGAKVVIGRDNGENKVLVSLEQPGYHLFMPHGFPGPVALFAGEPSPEEKIVVGSLILKYSKNVPGTKRNIRFGSESFEPDALLSDHVTELKRVGAKT